METPIKDATVLQAAGYSFEYPGFWSYDIGRFTATISDHVGLNGGLYEIQIMKDEGGTFVIGSDSHESVEAAIEKVGELIRALAI